MRKINAILCRPGDEPLTVRMPPFAATFREICGGQVEVVKLSSSVALYCGQDARLKGEPPNRMIRSHLGMLDIRGPFIICGYDAQGRAISLSREQAAYWLARITVTSL